MRHVIIGAGGAGTAAAETISANSDDEVVVINREKVLPYSPAALPYYIEGTVKRNELFIWNWHFVRSSGIEYLMGREVVKVDTERKKVILDNGEEIDYDRLLISTGAEPRIIPQFRRENVIGVRSIEDADRLRKVRGRVIIIGAGPVAVETSIALKKLGADPIIICRSRILRRLFDEDISDIIRDVMILNGVKVLFEKSIEVIGDPAEGIKAPCGVVYADLIVAALGVRPNMSFLDGRIELGGHGGILTNERMETSVENVYAAGDCAETRDLITGNYGIFAIWPLAREQGRVAGYNMMGGEKRYRGSINMNVITIFDKVFASIGTFAGARKEVWHGSHIAKLFIENGRLNGAQLVGKYALQYAGAVEYLVRSRRPVKINSMSDTKSFIKEVWEKVKAEA
jgi:nitrite reductase (NADH) large subunit